VRFTNLVRPEEGWQTKSTSVRFTDDHLSVVSASVKSPTGSQPQPWTIVHRKAAVVIAAMTADGKFLLIKEERIPIFATIWSMPAGQIDDAVEPDEKQIEAVALRELHEETGYELAAGGETISLGHFFTSPGFTDEHCYLFLARPVQHSAVPNPKKGEAILECRAFTAGDVSRMIASNEIRDANTLSIWARLQARDFLSTTNSVMERGSDGALRSQPLTS
jgi:ADP-ribose pyrophosphatase